MLRTQMSYFNSYLTISHAISIAWLDQINYINLHTIRYLMIQNLNYIFQYTSSN